MAHTKVWLRDAAGHASDLKIAPPADEKSALLAAACAPTSPASLEAHCDYGIFSRGAAPVLLQYYAKHLAGDWSKAGPQLAQSPRLALDIVPKIDNAQLALRVLYQGQGVAGSEVVVIDPAGKEYELKSDAEGRVCLPAVAGRYAIRANHVEPKRSGDRDGKHYEQTSHYATLTLDLPAGAAAETTDTAADLLRRARAARSVWDDSFPGFSADLTVTGNGQRVPAQLIIDASGTVKLEMVPSKLADWAEEQLNSLVQHRMPGGEVTQGTITFGDNDATHPLGRQIDLGDDQLKSVYRIKDDVIREVNRAAGADRFTISVLETVRNPEGKYLPRAFTMTFFDGTSGQIKVSFSYWNDWQRIGKFDLPKTILEIGARPGSTATRQIVFENVSMLK